MGVCRFDVCVSTNVYIYIYISIYLSIYLYIGLRSSSEARSSPRLVGHICREPGLPSLDQETQGGPREPRGGGEVDPKLLDQLALFQASSDCAFFHPFPRESYFTVLERTRSTDWTEPGRGEEQKKRKERERERQRESPKRSPRFIYLHFLQVF